MSNISIVIPTYNEKENIFKLSNRLIKLYPNSKIFIVDDTKNYNLNDYFKKNKKITYIYRKNKKGRGSAVIEGFKRAIKDNKIKFFVEMDADFSHKPEELGKNLKTFKNRKLDPYYIRGEAIKIQKEHRDRFISIINEILEKKSSRKKFTESHWNDVFLNKMGQMKKNTLIKEEIQLMKSKY